MICDSWVRATITRFSRSTEELGVVTSVPARALHRNTPFPNCQANVKSPYCSWVGCSSLKVCTYKEERTESSKFRAAKGNNATALFRSVTMRATRASFRLQSSGPSRPAVPPTSSALFVRRRGGNLPSTRGSCLAVHIAPSEGVRRFQIDRMNSAAPVFHVSFDSVSLFSSEPPFFTTERARRTFY